MIRTKPDWVPGAANLAYLASTMPMSGGSGQTQGIPTPQLPSRPTYLSPVPEAMTPTLMQATLFPRLRQAHRCPDGRARLRTATGMPCFARSNPGSGKR